MTSEVSTGLTESLFDRLASRTGQVDFDELPLYAHESRTHEIYGDAADIRVLKFFTHDGEKEIELGFLEYFEFLPSGDRDIMAIFMEMDDVDADPHIVYEALTHVMEDEPYLRSAYLLKVHVSEEWRGMGLAKFMLIATPVLLQGHYDFFTIFPFRGGFEDDTQRLKALVQAAGFNVSPVDSAIYWKNAGDEDRNLMENIHRILTVDGPHIGEPFQINPSAAHASN